MKAALLGLTFTLAIEGKKRNIHANAMAPLGASRMMQVAIAESKGSHSQGHKEADIKYSPLGRLLARDAKQACQGVA